MARRTKATSNPTTPNIVSARQKKTIVGASLGPFFFTSLEGVREKYYGLVEMRKY
jgi:hypothetical protein